jgi:RNase P/RNase MRP subunit POP5
MIQMKQSESNRLVLSILPHTEKIVFDFSDWVYYLIFGFNIDFRKMFTPLLEVQNPSWEICDDIIDQIELQGRNFERNIINKIKENLGSGLCVNSHQLFSSDGDSLKSEIASKIDTKVSYIRKMIGHGQIEFSDIPMRPIIFSLPFAISPTYNVIFNKPSGINIFTKEYRDADKKRIFFFTLNAALNTSSFNEFESVLVNNISKRKNISELNITQMNWKKFESISTIINSMCYSTFGSNQFSKSNSNLLKYGFSPTGSYLQLSSINLR